MANIVIKKNFVDGDKLFAQQLNNNFETIEKGINDGNKIVWQDGTEVKFKRYVTNDIDSLPILDGSIIYDTEKGRHYIDYQGKRIQVGSAGKEVLVQEEQPTEEDNKIWIDSDVVNTMGTEIMNEHSDSKIMGYSANYLNERLVKVSPTEPTTGEEVWIDNTNKKIYTKNDNDVYEEFNNVIVESGSNENGAWVKYSDGRMECWQRYGLNISIDKTFTYFGGQGYYKGIESKNFPKEFKELDCLIMNIESSQNQYALFLLTTATPASLTSTGTRLIASPSLDENDYVIISYHAIGRWK